MGYLHNKNYEGKYFMIADTTQRPEVRDRFRLAGQNKIPVSARRMGFALLTAFFMTEVPLPAAEGKQPDSMPSYQREITVECGSPEIARKADLKFLPLPPGKRVSFSCRWDDSNPRHLRMKKLMVKYGYKGTFYLTWPNDKFRKEVLPELCRDGCTIGNHTVSHPYLPQLTPNGVHYEMLAARIQHETLSGQTESAFVFPFGSFQWRFYPDAPDIIGSCLRRAGILGGPDHAMHRLNQIPGNEFYSPEGKLILPGDRNTRTEKFDSDVNRHLPPPGRTAHLVLGIHVWHSDADFLKLEESLKKYAHRPDWWYCNENEFLAYTCMYRHSRITGKKTDGKKAVFSLALPCPEYLGSETPLWAECAGKTIEIRHTRKVPVTIGGADPKGKVAAFPGVSAAISFPALNRIRFDADNTGAPLKDVRLVLRLPPDFTEETLCFHAGDITGKYRKEWIVTPNPAGQSMGKKLTALQIDFTRGGKTGRIWVSHLEIRKPASPAARVTCSTRKFTDPELKQLASPETSQGSFGFVPAESRINFRETIFHIPRDLRKAKDLTVLMDFPGGKKMTLKGNLPKTVFLNGNVLKAEKGIIHFDAPEGPCRILLQYEKPASLRGLLQLILTPAKPTDIERSAK